MGKYFLRAKLIIIVSAMMIFLGAFPAYSGSSNDKSDKNEPVSGSEKATENSGKPEGDKSPKSKIVFITTSEACNCTMTQCKKGEEAMNKALELFENLPEIERVDYAKETDKARELIKKYGAGILPVFLLLNEKEEALGMLQGEFEQKAVEEILLKRFKKKEARE